jgi:SAM-dependent methyltransferase
MTDDKTLSIYNAKAGDYAKLTKSAASSPDIASFAGQLPVGAKILDLGCGPGHISVHFASLGFQVDASDASPEMTRLAGARPGVTARCESFDTLATSPNYDGIFANFSLLHAARSDVPRHIREIANALNTGGVFHIGMKTGTGEARDPLGRHYCYFSEIELETMLTRGGLTLTYRNHGADLGLDGVMAEWVTLQARKN